MPKRTGRVVPRASSIISESSQPHLNGGFETVDTGVPPEMFAAMMGVESIEIPSAAEMLMLQAERRMGPRDLARIYRDAAQAMISLPEEQAAEQSKVWRSAIARAESGHLLSIPSGSRGLALVSLEAVANAVSCWNIKVDGTSLRNHKGKIFTEPGGIGKRLQVSMPGRSKKPLGAPARLLIWLDCGVVIWAPSWFFDARTVPVPFDDDSVRDCSHAASKALREYLWSMRGWNRREFLFGKPAGGKLICDALEVHCDETQRAESDTKASPPGDVIEQLHKAASAEFKRIHGIMPERYPFELFKIEPAARRTT